MSAAKEARLVVGGAPRVDLLPPEVRVRRQDARVNRVLVLVLVAVVALSGLTVLGAKAVADGSAARLAAAQERTAQLLAQQQRYAEVSTAKARLAAARAARASVAGTVIDWRAYLSSVSATLPSGVHVVGATVDTAGADTSGTAAAPAAGAALLPAGTVATLTLQVRTTRWGAVRAWLTALPALPGFLDAAPSTVSRDPQTGVTATVVVHLGAKAYGAPAAEPVPATPALNGGAAGATPSPSASASATPGPTNGPTASATASPSTTPSPSPAPAAPLAAGRSEGAGNG